MYQRYVLLIALIICSFAYPMEKERFAAKSPEELQELADVETYITVSLKQSVQDVEEAVQNILNDLPAFAYRSKLKEHADEIFKLSRRINELYSEPLSPNDRQLVSNLKATVEKLKNELQPRSARARYSGWGRY